MAQPQSGLSQLLREALSGCGEKSTGILLILSNLANVLLGRSWLRLEPVTSALSATRSKSPLLMYRD